MNNKLLALLGKKSEPEPIPISMNSQVEKEDLKDLSYNTFIEKEGVNNTTKNNFENLKNEIINFYRSHYVKIFELINIVLENQTTVYEIANTNYGRNVYIIEINIGDDKNQWSRKGFEKVYYRKDREDFGYFLRGKETGVVRLLTAIVDTSDKTIRFCGTIYSINIPTIVNYFDDMFPNSKKFTWGLDKSTKSELYQNLYKELNFIADELCAKFNSINKKLEENNYDLMDEAIKIYSK